MISSKDVRFFYLRTKEYLFAICAHPIGALLKSTAYLATLELREWLHSSADYRDSRLPFYQRRLLEIADQRPLRTCFDLLALPTLVVINAHIWHWKMPLSWREHSDTFKEFLPYFSNIWLIQATLAALTFPIVAGLVTFLFGQRDSATLRLTIYLNDACAVFMTVSSLTLVLYMGCQYKLYWSLDDKDVEWLLGLDLLWFCLNVAGTIYFLFRSFLFLLPDKREHIVRMHTLTIVWPRQARELLRRAFLNSAGTNNKILPAGRGTVFFGSLWRGMPTGIVVAQRYFKKTRYLDDVYFRPLGLVVSKWRKSVPVGSGDPDASGSTATLVFPLSFSLFYKKQTQVCRIDAGPKIGRIGRLLINASVSFTSNYRLQDVKSVESLLEELRLDILSAISSRQYNTFHERYRTYIDFLTFLISASEYGLDNKFNLTLIPGTKMDDRVYAVWLALNEEIVDACIGALPDNPDFFRFVAYAPSTYFLNLRNLEDIEIPRATLELSLNAFRALGDWWKKTVEYQGFSDHGKCSPATLKPPELGAHTYSLDHFVGSYEGLRRNWFTGLRSLQFDRWKEVQDTERLHIAHIGHIGVMIFDALNHGDRNGAMSAADMLQSWCNALFLRGQAALDTPHRAWELTAFDVLAKTREQAQELAKRIRTLDEDDGNSVERFVGRTLLNLWRDHIFVVTVALIRSNVGCKCETSLPAELARVLMHGTPVSDGVAHLASPIALQTRTDGFESIIRLQLAAVSAPADQETYYTILSTAHQRLGRTTDRRVIPGRPYSSGGNSLEATFEGQFLLLMLLPDSGWNPTRHFTDLVARIVGENREMAESLRIHFKVLLDRLNLNSFDAYAEVFKCLSPGSSSDDFKKGRQRLAKQFDEIIAIFNKHIDQALAATPVDQKKLDAISKAAKSAFGASGAAPVIFFGKTEKTQGDTELMNFTITDQDKSDYLKTSPQPPVLIEDGYIEEAMRNNLAFFVMRAVQRRMKLHAVETSSAEAYWREFMAASADLRKRGLTPVLLLENRVVPRWVWQWMTSSTSQHAFIPTDLKVVKNEKMDEKTGYETTINDVDVYEAAVEKGSSLILPKEAFETITYRDYGKGRLVKVVAEDVKDKPSLVDVKLSWGFKFEIDERYENLGTKLVYGIRRAEEE